MIQEASEYRIRELLAQTIAARWRNIFGPDKVLEIDEVDSNKIIVQLNALGLIALAEGRKGVKDRGTTFWSLTPYGAEYMNKLVAIRKS